MRIHPDEQGSLNVLLIPLILTVLLLFGAIGFGVWAFGERNDYKTNVDSKIDTAVEVAVERTKTEKDNEFIEKEKEPLKGYLSPGQYGSFNLKYPKTWSAYVNDRSNQFELRAHPDVVPEGQKTAYALRIEVVSTAYDQVVNQYESNIRQGKARAAAYSLPKVKGAAVLLPLRDKTLKLTVETQERVADFNNIILPNFEFRP